MKMKLFLLTILSTQALFGAAASAADRGPIDAAITDVALALPRRTVQDVLDEEGIKPDSKLERLDFDLKGITDIVPGKFAYFSELKILDLSYNKITNIPEGAFAGLSNLEGLYLNRNEITNIPEGAFAGLSNLEYLDLSNNKITNIPAFAGLSNLEYLHLSYNEITSVSEGAFTGLVKLEILSLSNNKITNIPEGVFVGLEKLKELGLYSNPLEDVAPNAFHGIDKNVRIFIDSIFGGNEIPLEGIQKIKEALYCKEHDLFKVDHPCKIKDINPRDPHVCPDLEEPISREQFFSKCMDEYMSRHPELYEKPCNMYGAVLCKGTPGW